MSTPRPAFGAAMYFMITFTLGSYFTFAAVQGDYGVFRRVQIDAEVEMLKEERDQLQTELSALQNKTRRLSDDYLDIDLLDEQARDVLGLIRADEIVIR
ncbi:MAG: septum formation initiator precursor [Cereibacter sphaeroides]|uniref:Septum formation initiator n=1 Tax=Cereibacter sphaeroides TaxID=1063 RepID=A0A2W5U8R0_CERSP|nr:MAG: septum formation initiator precursor [Cereibacter sphaeroides]